MGYETRCLARVTDATGNVRDGEGAVLLETDDLIVRGDARVRVPRASIVSATVGDGWLTVVHPTGTISLQLGDDAAKWLTRVQAPPKARLDKLDVKPGARVWLAGITDETLGNELRTRTPHVDTSAVAPNDYDVAFLQIDTLANLPRIAAAAATLKPSASLWVVHPKGKTGVPDTAIFGAAAAAGLTYTKVAKISETYSAEKLVRPKSSRRAAQS